VSVKRSYECDLCGRTLPFQQLIGLHWQGGATRVIPKYPGGVEHHICPPCVDDVAKMQGCGEYVAAKAEGGPE
jgi:hypothetical protein